MHPPRKVLFYKVLCLHLFELLPLWQLLRSSQAVSYSSGLIKQVSVILLLTMG